MTVELRPRSTTAAFTLPAKSFPLGSAVENHSSIAVELERIVPTNRAVIPHIWVRGIGDAERTDTDAVLADHDGVQRSKLVDAGNDDPSFEWGEGPITPEYWGLSHRHPWLCTPVSEIPNSGRLRVAATSANSSEEP